LTIKEALTGEKKTESVTLRGMTARWFSSVRLKKGELEVKKVFLFRSRIICFTNPLSDGVMEEEGASREFFDTVRSKREKIPHACEKNPSSDGEVCTDSLPLEEETTAINAMFLPKRLTWLGGSAVGMREGPGVGLLVCSLYENL